MTALFLMLASSPLASPLTSHAADAPGADAASPARLSFDCASVTEIPQTECQALVDLYTSTNGAGWLYNSNWLASTTPSNWWGVTVSGGHVTGIDMNSNNLVGTLPASIDDLTALTDLALDWNILTGALPPEVGNLSQLTTLTLGGNSFSGALPSELGGLSNLVTLRVEWNDFSGAIPTSLGNLNSLTELSLSGNSFTGAIPPEMGNFDSIQRLDLSDISTLTGGIPIALGNLSTLKVLDLANSNLTGTIPAAFSNLSNLEQLFLTNNHLSGSIPPELGNLTKLTALDLSHNQLSGAVPADIGNLALLETLAISYNALVGDLPITLTNLTALSGTVDFGYNMLTASDLSLRNFLNTVDPNWAYTQTVPPDNVAADAISSTGIRVSWTPLLYQTNGGYYEVASSSTPGGPYTSVCTTADKSATSCDVTGLVSGATYYFVVRTYTPTFPGQQNALLSWYGDEVEGTTSAIPFCDTVTDIPLAECESLYNLYENTDGLNWTDNTNWRITNTPDDWYGVTVSGGHVTALNLSTNGLTGTLTTELDELSGLVTLDLSGNALAGNLPAGIGGLTALQSLDLSHNDFAGSIPAAFGGMTALQALNLNDNQLTGSLPTELGSLSALENFSAAGNALSGSLPASLGSISPLVTLDLSGNDLNGTLPAELGSLSNLVTLDLTHNEFTGPLPTGLGGLSALQTLNLADNSFDGSIPTTFSGLTALHTLDLSYNKFSGTVPTELGGLTTLTSLNLSLNGLHGPLPTSLTGLTGLTTLDLGYNALWTDDSALQTFLDGKDPDWMATQTVAPTNIAATATGSASVRVSWTPIAFTDHSGYYEVRYSETPGGPYSLGCSTADKTAQYCTVNALTGGTTYYFIARTYTPTFPGQQTALWSDYTVEVSATTSTLPFCDTVSEIPIAECEALITLYDDTGGADWTTDTNWMTTNTPSVWYGVIVSGGHVTRIELPANGLAGPLSDTLGDLDALTTLNLSGNDLNGALPAAIGDMDSLTTLRLDDNLFNGTLPGELGSLSTLQTLDLSGNTLSGAIPTTFGGLTNLQTLDLSDNNLDSGIPAALGSLASLQTLNLAQNPLTGSIPSELGSLANLQSLDLSATQLTGMLPSALGSLTNLQTLHLSDNALTGAIPATFGGLTSLQTLDMGQNRLSSALPTELGSLTALTTLDLSDNRLSGALPASLTNLTALTAGTGLDLGYNMLWTSNTTLSAFLDTKDTDWKTTQTIPPSNLSASAQAADTLLLNWGAIPYTGDGGYYQAGYSETPGGPYFPGCTTADKVITSCEITGLTPEMTYYLAVRTFTPAHGSQQNDLWSPFSVDVSAVTQEAPLCDRMTDIPAAECEALSALYGATGGLNYWDTTTNWLESTTAADWYGVTVSGGHVTGLDLAGNDLNGSLPAALGQLTSLQTLNLAGNNLSGALPSELGSLTALTTLNLAANRLEGPVPAAYTGLTVLTAGTGLDLGYNLLWASDPLLVSFLTSKDTDWRTTQTVAPASLAHTTITDSSIKLTWTPIAYSAGNGYYEVGASLDPAGPFTPVCQTADKTESTCTAIDLEPDTTYYFAVRTFSEKPASGLQDEDLTSAYSAAISGTTGPLPPNLIVNGYFNDGENNWGFFGPVSHSVIAGFERLYHLTTPGSAGFYQTIRHSLPANAPMEVKIGLGNSSNYGKVIAVVLRDPSWTDMLICYFDLPARTPVQTYTMRGVTKTAHSSMVFATYLYPDDGKPMVWVDAISVRHRPGLVISGGVECERPIATPNINLIANGEFGEGTASWDFGTLVRQVWENVLYMFRKSGTELKQSVMYQVTTQRIPADMPVEMTLDLGNTSSGPKTVVVSLHNWDWSDNYVCYFNIPAYSARQTYTIHGRTTVPWERLVLVFYLAPDDGLSAIAMDNVNVQYKPGLAVSGMECLYPTGEAVSEAASEAIAPPDTTPDTTPDAATEPTPEPTTSVFGPDRTFELVEAEDDILVRRGLWSITDSSAASGTGYIFSGGNADDTLTLAFYGDAVEVIYVQHPALGSFAVEVDGEVRATVDTTAPESVFGQRVVVDGLAESEHQLRIIPTDGAIAIDAVVVEGYFETSSSLD